MTGPALILAAILLCRPAIPLPEARAYAALVSTAPADPLLVVALIDRETGWVARAVSSDGAYVGLGQVAWRFRCVRGLATVRRARCASERRRLLDGAYNLRAVFSIINDWRELCRRTTGQVATVAGWISAYEGVRGQTCGLQRDSNGRWAEAPQPRVTREILARAEELRRRLSP